MQANELSQHLESGPPALFLGVAQKIVNGRFDPISIDPVARDRVAACAMWELAFVVRGRGVSDTGIVRTTAQGSSDLAFPVDLAKPEANGARYWLRTLSRLNAHAIHLPYRTVRPGGPIVGDRRAVSPVPEDSSGFEPMPVPTCVTAGSPDRAALRLRIWL
jgi:hypothetical protein